MPNGAAEDPTRPLQPADAPSSAPASTPPPASVTVASSPTAPAPAPAPTPAPKKRRTGCYVVGCFAVFLLCCCVSSVIAGMVGLSSLSGTTRPKDLRVSYTEADFDKVLKDINLDFKPSADWTNPEVVTTYSGKQEIDYTFTDQAFSAFANYTHSARFPVDQLQIKFSEGGQAESSMVFNYAGRPYPVYLVGTIDGASGRSVSGSLSRVEIAGYTLPDQYLEMAGEYLFAMINARLGRMEALDIQTLEFTEGGVRLVGTIPQTAERGPATSTDGTGD